MCRNGKCFLCIPVETACFVLAIIRTVIMGILMLVCLGLAFSSTMSEITGLLCVLFAVSFSFSVVLCNGIHRRESGQVKTYFIFGVVWLVLEAIGAMASTAGVGPYNIMFLFLCVLSCLFLKLVHVTYYKLFESKTDLIVV